MTGTGSRQRVREHRARVRAQGLRPVQIWVPDVGAPGFGEEAHHQSRAVSASTCLACLVGRRHSYSNFAEVRSRVQSFQRIGQF